MNTTENFISTPQVENNIVKPIKFPNQPQEWKIVSLRECLTPAEIQLCDTPPASLSAAYSASAPMGTFAAADSLDASASYGATYYGSGGDLYFGGSGYGGSDFSYYWNTPSWYGSPLFYPYVPSVVQYQVTATFTPPSQVNLAQQVNALYNFPQSTPVTTSLIHALDSGNTGIPVWKNQVNYTYEPVNVMSGEFYEDTVDLTVAGPMPLQLRRNYSSQNQDDRNGFGYGWNVNIVPYISIATNTTASSTNIVLTAVELDGSVIAYRQQTNNPNLFLPTTADNPQLDNFGNGHIGSIFNPFNAKIVYSTNGTNQIYTLTQADGQTRTYIVNSFPVSTPTNTISRTRPYLASWQDTQGNSWTFIYDTNSSDPAYGSVIRINSSNGNYLGLDYNAAGYAVDAYTSDGEKVSYQYDDFGDLVLAVRADQSEETYEYQHTQYTNSGTVYVDSTHLMAFDFKPDGRVVQNIFDNQRRVTVQLATIGADLNVYTNAVFTYSNNFVLTNAWTNHITGYTLVKDVNGNTNRYDYANSLVTTNTDQLGQQVIQIWCADNAMAPGYRHEFLLPLGPVSRRVTQNTIQTMLESFEVFQPIPAFQRIHLFIPCWRVWFRTVVPARQRLGNNGKSRERNQACFQLRNIDTSPMTAATVPPMSIQMALSVGEPLKNRDTSELKEFVALMPMIMITTPPISRAREIILFITAFQ